MTVLSVGRLLSLCHILFPLVVNLSPEPPDTEHAGEIEGEQPLDGPRSASPEDAVSDQKVDICPAMTPIESDWAKTAASSGPNVVVGLRGLEDKADIGAVSES